MQIHEIMSKNIISINSDATVVEACKRYYRNRIGSLVVLDQGILKGILTERDIISRVIILQKDPNTTTVDEIMTSDVKTINQNANVEEAAKLLSSNNIKKLPVVSDTGNLVGIVTVSDISHSLSNVPKTVTESV